MSAHYDLMPLAPVVSLPKKHLWLENMGLVIPDAWENSRNPTANEVRFVIRQLVNANKISVEADFHVAGDDLDATIVTEQNSAFLSVEDYAIDCDEDVPRHLSFQYGDPELVLPICERLARLCGPFLLTNNGAFFVIVDAGTQPDVDWVADDF